MSRLIGPKRGLQSPLSQMSPILNDMAVSVANEVMKKNKVETSANATSMAKAAAVATMAAAASVVSNASSEAKTNDNIKLSFLEKLHEWIKTRLFGNENLVIAFTGLYFGYVILGGVSSEELHKHILTVEKDHQDESFWSRLSKGKLINFREEIYEEYFSLESGQRDRLHSIATGICLLSGVYNLRNPPTYVTTENGKRLFDGWLHARLSGFSYVGAGFLKGLLAILIAFKAKNAGLTRIPMIGFALWELASLANALKAIKNGNILAHKQWMIRNFAIGSGPMWTKLFAFILALFDLDFMNNIDMFGKLHNLLISTGGMQGILFGEYWLSSDSKSRQSMEIAQGLNGLVTVLGAITVYREMRNEQIRLQVSNLAKRPNNNNNTLHDLNPQKLEFE